MVQERIVVKHRDISYAVKIKDIFFVESNDKRVIIYTETGSLECAGQISDYEGLSGFFRCHRCYMVNMEHVVSYSANSVTLANNQMIHMSRRRRAAFAAAYLEQLNAAVPSYR